MTIYVVYNHKKEKEKKKQKKRQEKDEKKLERKASASKGGLEDMIAYVDEFGNITSTPPDPKNKAEINTIQFNYLRKINIIMNVFVIFHGVCTFYFA